MLKDYDDRIAKTVLAGAGPRLRKEMSISEAAVRQAVYAGLVALDAAYRKTSGVAETPAALRAFVADDEVVEEFRPILRGAELPANDIVYVAESADAYSGLHRDALVLGLHAFEAAFRTSLSVNAQVAPPIAAPPGRISAEQMNAIAELVRAIREAGLPDSGLTAEQITAGNVVAGQQIIFHWPASGGTEPDQSALRSAYLHTLLRLCRRLSLAGIDPHAAADSSHTLLLDAVFVSLYTSIPSAPQLGKKTQRAFSTAIEQLGEKPRIVFMGEPGSGKTSFVNFVCACLAGEMLGDPAVNLERLAPTEAELNGLDHGPELTWDVRRAWTNRSLLPLRIILRDFAARGLPSPTEPVSLEHLWQFIGAELADWGLADFAPKMREELLQKGGVIFLDGLDEIPDANVRRIQIKRIVEQLATTFHLCRIVVTSRTYAYQRQDWKLDHFEEAVIIDLQPRQVEVFVDRWYEHLSEIRDLPSTQATGRAELLKQAIRNSPALSELAVRPLLLTLMASLHAWRGGSLPDRREELYADAVDLLLESWEGQRVVYNSDGTVAAIQPSLAEFLKVDRTRVRELLEQLAFEAHLGQSGDTGTADIDEDSLVAGLTRISQNPDVRPARLLEYLSQRAGLLVPRGVGVYTFPHRTFQEYLAACHLTGEAYPDELVALVRDEPGRWREVALLAAAKAARGAASTLWSLVDAFVYEEPGDSCARSADWRGMLAGQVLCENGVDPARIYPQHRPKIERVIKWQIYFMRDGEKPAVDRAIAGNNLGKLGDPRTGLLTVAGMEFCWIPPGPFRMGATHADVYKYDTIKVRQADASTLDIPYGYWLARFPVSAAQYQEFLDADGYGTAEFWTEAARHAVWKPHRLRIDANGREYGLFESRDSSWLEPQAIHRSDDRFPTSAMWGLNWYEGLAFCRWVTATHPGIRRAGLVAAIPSEAEWEKGARGGLQLPVRPVVSPMSGLTVPSVVDMTANPDPERLYPYGGREPDPNRIFVSECGIRINTILGCFPGGVSPYGCEEMSGTWFEPTRSCYGRNLHSVEYPYPYRLDPEREKYDSKLMRVFRGGQQGIEGESANVTRRHPCEPDELRRAFALRVALVPAAAVEAL